MELRKMKVKMMFRRNPKKVQQKVVHLKNSSMKTQRITIWAEILNFSISLQLTTPNRSFDTRSSKMPYNLLFGWTKRTSLLLSRHALAAVAREFLNSSSPHNSLTTTIYFHSSTGKPLQSTPAPLKLACPITLTASSLSKNLPSFNSLKISLKSNMVQLKRLNSVANLDNEWPSRRKISLWLRKKKLR